MAGPLQDKISRYRGTSGTLQDTTQEELQTLSGKAGLQAQPTDPISAQTIGASPHQSKMAASPQVVQSSLALSQMDPSQGLAAAARRAQARTQATDEESAEKAKADKLLQLGDTGKRVQSAIDTAIQGLASTHLGAGQIGQVDQGAVAAALPAGAGTPLHTGPGGSSPVLASLKGDLQTLLSNPTDQQALLRVETALGRGPSNPLTPTELQGLYQSSVDAITAQGAAGVVQGLSVGDLASRPEFGYTTESLGALLGLPADQVSTMTVPQLQAAVGQLQQQEMSKAAQLDQQAGSRVLGSAERATAGDLGREASATGLRASEAQVARMQESLSRADRVMFAGKDWSVEDLLGNDQVSHVVHDYLTSPEGSQTRSQLSQTEPQLVKWIEEHKAVLSEAAAQIGKGAGQFASTQKANSGVGTFGGQSLSPEALSAILPGAAGLHAGALDTSKAPVLQHLAGLAPAQAATAVQTINSLTPSQRQELAGLSSSEIAALELGLGAGSPVMKALAENSAARTQVSSISPSDADSVYSYFTGEPGLTAEEAQHQLDDLHAASLLGLANYGTAGGLDQDRDGRLDSPQDLHARMLSSIPGVSLKDALTGKGSGATGIQRSDQPHKFTLDQAKVDPQAQSVYNMLKSYGADDNISATEIADSGLTKDEGLLRYYLGSPMSRSLSPATKDYLQGQVAKFTKAHTAELLDKYPREPDERIDRTIREHSTDPDYLENLARATRTRYQELDRAAKDSEPGHIDSTTVQQRVAALETQMRKLDAAAALIRPVDKNILNTTELHRNKKKIAEDYGDLPPPKFSPVI